MKGHDLQQDLSAFNLWLAEEGEDNQSDIDHLKRMLPVAIKTCCTEKQRIYIMHFFADGMMMKEIATLYGVNPSTVSRCIKRGMRNIHSRLRFCSPAVCVDMQKQGRLTQGGIALRKR